jgi:hypothetical protein
MAGFDPNMSNRALEALGATYRVPVNTAQPLTPEEAALGQMQAQNLAAQDAYAAYSPSHMGAAAPSHEPTAQPSIPLDWQPQPAQPIPEQAPVEQHPSEPRYTPEELRMLLAGQGGQPQRQANPFGGMLWEATANRKQAEAKAESQNEAITGAVEDRKQSESDIGRAQSDAYAEIAKIQDEAAKSADPYIKELEGIQADREKALLRSEEQQRKYADFIGGYDPKDRRSMTTKVMGALAVGLGQMVDQNNLVAGLMQGMNVQTNNADVTADLIQRGIDRDIEMQRQMVENKRTAAAATNTLVGQINDRFDGKVDSVKLARVTYLDQAIKQMEAVKSRGLSAEALATANGAIAKLEEERQKELFTLSRQDVARYTNEERAIRAAAAGPRPLSEKERLTNRKMELENAKLEKELGGSGAGAYGLKPIDPNRQVSEKAVEKAQEIASGDAALAETLNQLDEMARKGATMADTERATAARRMMALGPQLSNTFGSGAPSKEQLAEYSSKILNPTEVNIADVRKFFADFKTDMRAMTNAKLKTYNLTLDDVDVRPE